MKHSSSHHASLMTSIYRMCRAHHLNPFMRLVAALIVSFFSVSANAQAPDDKEALEYRVKAAFLYKFAGYVTWPPAVFNRPDAAVVFGIIGSEAVAAALEKSTSGRTLGDRKIVVRRVKAGDSLAGLQVLFVGKAESARLAQIAGVAQANSVLTVTEGDGALRQGSVINFIIGDERVRFEISLDSANKSGLKLSSQLLAVAQQVLQGAP